MLVCSVRYASRLSLLAFACVMAGSNSAFATGNFLCEIDDQSLKLTAESTFSHGLGERFMNFGAAGTVRLKGAAKDLADLKFDGEQLVHHWFAGENLNLHLYREREGEAAHGFVELVIETKTKPDDETVTEGTYKLHVFDTGQPNEGEAQSLKAEGKVSCSVG